MTDAAALTPTPAEAHAATVQLMGQRFEIERQAVIDGKSLGEALALGREFETARAGKGKLPDATAKLFTGFENQSLDEHQRSLEQRVYDETMDFFADKYGVNAEVRAQLKAGNPVSGEEMRAAAQWLDRATKDQAWVKRFKSGDHEAQRQWFLATSIIAGDIKESKS